jgi:hypothetical protein
MRMRTNRNEIARLLGGDVNGSWLNLAGPGHRTSDRSLGVKFDANAPDGFFINSFASDDPAICRDYVKQRLGQVADGTLIVDEGAVDEDDPQQTARIASAMKIWDNAQPALGTLAEKYLQARGCVLTPDLIAADTLRYHPLCPFGSDRVPTMLALMTDTLTGVPTGIHRTALRNDGLGKRKMPNGLPAKMMMGRAKNSVVRLAEIENGHLAIGEGIETSLSAAQLFSIPVWAALSASAVSAFPITPGVSHLTVFADNDDVGLLAAQKCGGRQAEAGIAGNILYPPMKRTDWNDFLMKGSV